MLAAKLGLPRQSEILIIIFLGICFLSLDFSLFHLRSSLEEIWSTDLDLDKTKYLETPLKYIIIGVLLVRTFTLHAFLAFYVVMLWPAIFEEKPSLMLPWLLLGIIRCLILNIITFVVGSYICQKERGFSPICFEYILAQFIEHGPSVYAWMAMLKELVHEDESPYSSMDSLLSKNNSSKTESFEQNSSKERSHSMSSLNQDYLFSSKLKVLPGDVSIEKMISAIRNEFNGTRQILRNGSKSFDDSFIKFDDIDESIGGSLTAVEKSFITLAVTRAYADKARQQKNRYADIVKDISIQDVDVLDKKIDATDDANSELSEIKKRPKAIRIIQSHSDNEIIKSKKCHCTYRRLQKEYSQQALLIEQEIANVRLDLNSSYKALEKQIIEATQTRSCCNKNKKILIACIKQHLN